MIQSKKHRFPNRRFRGPVANSFCQGKFKLSERERLMYRAFWRLYNRPEPQKNGQL
jgi:hypothetical protein